MTSIIFSVTRDVRLAPTPGHTAREDETYKKLRDMVITQPRFGRRCAFCDFAFGDTPDFELHHLDGDHANATPENMVPICVLCHAPFHIDLVGRRWRKDPGTIIYLPEIDQARLNSLLQAVFYAKAQQGRSGGLFASGKSADEDVTPVGAAHSIHIGLLERAKLVEQLPDGSIGRPKLSNPTTLARVLSAMNEDEYSKRTELLSGLRYLPPESYLIEEAKRWSVNGAAFSGLDIAAWPSISGQARA